MEKLVEEIRGFFPEFPICISNLKSPTASFVRDFFCKALMELGVDVDNVRRIQVQQLDAQEVDIIPELNLLTAIRKAFPFLDFRLNDLISPEIKRNVFLMNRTMCFLEFCETCCSNLNKQMKEIQEARNTERELAKTKETESIQLNHLACEVDNNVQTQKRLESDIAKLQVDVENYKQTYNGVSEEMEQIKEIYDAKTSKINSLEKEIQLKLAEYEELRKLIVLNPEEEQKDLDIKSRDRVRVLEKKRDYQEQLKSLEENKEKLQKLCLLLNKKAKPVIQELHILLEYSEQRNNNEKNEENLKELLIEKEETLKSLEEINKRIEIEKNGDKRLSELEKEECKLNETLAMKRSEYKLIREQAKQEQMKIKQELQKALSHISALENDYATFLKLFNTAKELAFDNLNN